jgi:hypothetical protein
MELVPAQAGVVARRQLLAVGVTDVEIERRLRRNEWGRLHPGVYVEHNGPPTWEQQAWGAVLYQWPAALADESALLAFGVRGYEPRPGAPIRICVDRSRAVRRRVGIHVRQLAHWGDLCLLQLSPPRQRLEHALLGVASGRPKLEGSVAVLADAVQAGRTTTTRLQVALRERPRLRNRAILLDVVGDVREGARSVLEYRYLAKVERPHGLPVAVRQRSVALDARLVYRDVDHRDFGVVIELDGRLAHRPENSWSDLERDIATFIAGELVLRLGWQHVLDECRLAKAVGTLLQARGWTGELRGCHSDCAAISAPGAEDAAQMG